MITENDLKQLGPLIRELASLEKQIMGLHTPPGLAFDFPAQQKETAAAVEELRRVLQARRELCARQLEGLRAFYESIPDAFTRDLFRRRYIDGETWLQIQYAMMERGYFCSAENLKMTCFRYLERVNKND